MTARKPLPGELRPAGEVPHTLAPLTLGDPESPALTLRDRPQQGDVELRAAHPVVLVGPAGVEALRHWTGCHLAKSRPDQQTGNWSNPPELWTATGITQETGVPVRTVRAWVKRDDFPRPFAHPVGGGPVWEADTVKAWLLTSRPRRGRPRP